MIRFHLKAIVMKEEKDGYLWQQAKARAAFKMHFMVYVIVISALWVIWLFSEGVGTHPWPIWPTVGWGIAIVSNYFSAYKFNNTAEREYEKLKGE
jgi:hypothetical protein